MILQLQAQAQQPSLVKGNSGMDSFRIIKRIIWSTDWSGNTAQSDALSLGQSNDVDLLLLFFGVCVAAASVSSRSAIPSRRSWCALAAQLLFTTNVHVSVACWRPRSRPMRALLVLSVARACDSGLCR